MACCGFCRADLAYTEHVLLKSLLIWGRKQPGSCLQAKEVVFLAINCFLALTHIMEHLLICKAEVVNELHWEVFCGSPRSNSINWETEAVFQ